MHQPPPSMKLEYGQCSNQSKSSFDQLKGVVETRNDYDKDPSVEALYSPTKPTSTPTKTELRSQDFSEAATKGKLSRTKIMQRVIDMNYCECTSGCLWTY